MGRDTQDNMCTPAHVRASCAVFMEEKAKSVKISQEKIDSLASTVNPEQFAALSDPVRYPLAFRSLSDELNFIALVNLLNFGSGYRKPLHQITERGAHETMTFGAIGLYISEPRLDAKFLRGLSLESVASYFSLPTERDEQLSPGIYISKPGPLKPLAESIQKVLNESGQILLDLGFEDFGAFLIAKIKNTPTTASDLVEIIATTFPAFHDVSGSVSFLKKAQCFVASLYRRFADEDEAFKFEDIAKLTAFSDSGLPCVLHAMGILEYSAELEEQIEKETLLPHGGVEVELRAAAVVACDQIIAASGFDMISLGSYLWRIGKEPTYRSKKRHATQDTVYY
ncbi:hypothetical protein THRCLA_07508 [Thraustotheca clavata]|uniref:Queuosine 5'-phosphate N-glycosylase/hydrolase n=1 Tax=Thraustotheca clavata TaxID=74557 RepID=A0A1V9ZCY6_9STRA|nr:hypothetical protein THRCLA_07508 [Thraustotheca clavata]